MSALGHKRTLAYFGFMIRFTPESGHDLSQLTTIYDLTRGRVIFRHRD
jgi:hypothetical protein